MPETAIYYDKNNRYYKVVNGMVIRLNSRDPNDVYLTRDGNYDAFQYNKTVEASLTPYDANLHGGKKLRKKSRKKSRKNRKHKTKSAKKRTARKH